MNISEIKEKIYSLKNEEEIKEFIKLRDKELDDSNIEKTVGQNYTDSFREYISSKIHYKAVEKRSEDKESPDLVYDDMEPYVELIKMILNNPNKYDEFNIMTTIFWATNNYLVSEDNLLRAMTYTFNKDKVSIKEISKNNCGFCSEKAGLSHNMLKLLGFDSEVIGGARDNDLHAYNIYYPNGYDNQPAIIFDPSFFVDFVNEENRYSFASFIVCNKEKIEQLKAGEPVKFNYSNTERFYRELYGLDGYDFKVDGNNEPTYVFGLDSAKEYLEENDYKKLK